MSISAIHRAVALAPLVTWLFLGLGFAAAASPEVERADFVEAEHTQHWRMTSFLEDANLQGRGIFHIDFETGGTVWIAASDGLYRYDGYRWKRFTSADGLPSDYVRSVRVTRDGQLWVGTDRGAGTFDGTNFDTRGSEDHLPGPSVRRIVEDPDGTLWFACDQWPPATVRAGLARYRGGSWTTWRSEDGLPSDYVSDVFRDRSGRHFVLTRGGLAEFEGDRLRRPIEEAGLQECRDYIWSMVETPNGQLVATAVDAVCVRNDGEWTINRSDPHSIGGNPLMVTNDGVVLAFTNDREGRFVEWRGDRFVPIWTTSIETSGKVESIAEAPDGSIWVAGVNFLARWERSGGEWGTFDGLPRPLLRDTEQGVWFAGRDRVLRLNDGRWAEFPGASGPLIQDRSGGVWMFTADGMLRWTEMQRTSFAESEIGVRNPISVQVDGRGSLWVCGEGTKGRKRVAMFDGERWESRDLTDVAAGERIVHAAPDADRGMWYVTEDRETELYRLLRVDDEHDVEVPLPAETRRFWIPRVQADSDGNLWLYGLAGLYKRDLDLDGSGWRRVEGLPGRQVLNLGVRGNEIWFSYIGSTGGSGGVSRLLDGAWRHFSSAARDLVADHETDLLFFAHPQGVHFVAGETAASPRLLTLPEPAQIHSLVAGPETDFWISAGERVFHYRPDGIPPETVVTGGDKNVSHGEDLVLQVRGVEKFIPRDHSRNFNVAVRVDEQPWSEFEPLSEGTLRVAGLDTGDHIVQVRVQDQGLDIDPTPAVWRVVLHPIPLQARTWFQPLAAGVFLTVLLLAILSIVARRRAVRHRERRLEAEHELLQISEREKRRIGRDLHDSLGQRLTGISFQCEALRGRMDRGDTSSSQHAGDIGAAVRDAISETRRMAYALYPPEIDRGNLEVALGSLVASTGRGFEGSCEYRHRFSPDPLKRESALHVYRMVQEALGNAIRHAGATRLEVESRLDGGDWIVEVRDDGRGFDANRDDVAGLGLQIMRYRADLIGGRLRVESARGAGTTIRCVVPMARDGKEPELTR